tara:strand:- start:4568 stop:4939 length:372 start_codon:yes stop_codon:yes gene_type:complete
MATYVWTISKLFTKDITEDGTTYSDVITRVEGKLTGTSETVGSITGENGFDLDMNVSNLASGFTAYNSITEANVQLWVENRLTPSIIASIKTGIENEIEFLEKVHESNPKEDSEGNPTFPWGT